MTQSVGVGHKVAFCDSFRDSLATALESVLRVVAVLETMLLAEWHVVAGSTE